MEFPPYVPGVVRICLTEMIEGSELRKHGWATSLENSNQELNAIEEAIEKSYTRGEVDDLVYRTQKRVEAVERRDLFGGEVDCLRRLIHDPRMRDAYALLTYEITDDEQWSGFVESAWAARGDFAEHRERLKKAEEQRIEIADTATKLAKQLEEFSRIGITGPDDFYSVRELLRKTDHDDSRGGDSEIWKVTRKHVVGENLEQGCELEKQHELELPLPELERDWEADGKQIMHEISIRFVLPGDVGEQNPLAGLRYGWEKAPPLSALLKTVAKAALDFEPGEDGVIDAALASRQGSVKSEYIRALAYLLCKRHKFHLTSGVMRAMAITSNVVINNPDVDVTYDDVRKAFVIPRV
jgi:hypothetical protein